MLMKYYIDMPFYQYNPFCIKYHSRCCNNILIKACLIKSVNSYNNFYELHDNVQYSALHQKAL